MPTSDEVWRDLCENDGLDRTACVEPRGAYNPNPEDDWKAFKRKFEHSFARVLGHDEATPNDLAALRDVFRMKIDQDWFLAKLVRYDGTGQFRKPKANAYWLRNQLADDWANQARDGRGWWSGEYEGSVNR